MRARRPFLLLTAAVVVACFGETPTSPGGINTEQPPPPALAGVSLAVGAGTKVFLGTSRQLIGTAVDQNGGTFVGATITWKSSAPAILSVTPTGRVTANALGQAVITATAATIDNTVSASVPLTVSTDAPALSVVSMVPLVATFDIGQTLHLTARPTDQYGDVFGATVTWHSSNSNVAEVDAAGVVTGISAGTATITASASAPGGTQTATAQITVSAAAVLSAVVVTPSPVNVTVGSTVQLTASARDGTNHAIVAPIVWSGADPALATVTQTGLVTTHAVGDVYIAATATSGAFEITGNALIHIVTVPPPTAFVTATLVNTFEPSTVEVAKGGTVSWDFRSSNSVTFAPTAGAPASIPVSLGGPVSRTFNTVGTFTYTSTVHPEMSGTVIVR